MDLTLYVDNLRYELAVAADAGGEDARALAERLAASIESATRLTLLDALSGAADEITRHLAPGSVEVRLRGRDPEFVVTLPPATELFDDVADSNVDVARSGAVQPAAPAPPDADESATTRINLRLPEHLKLRVEEVAARESTSVNAWLVRVAAAALRVDRDHSRGLLGGRVGQHYTGWVR